MIEEKQDGDCQRCGGKGCIACDAREQEPVALKKGECWPEEVMRQWDYWRKEIANGHTGSAPRDWFEGLSELRLIDTHPQSLVGLTPEEVSAIWQSMGTWSSTNIQAVYNAIWKAIKEKNSV